MEAVYAFVNFVVTVGEVVAGAAGITIPITTAGTVTAAIIGTTAIVGGTIGLSKLYEIEMNVPDTDYARQRTVKGGTQPVKTVYGEALVSGPIAFVGAGNTNNSSLYHVIALTGHESEAITDMYFDNVKIQNSDINGGSAAGGAVGGSTVYGPVNSTTITYINKHLGDESTADTMVNNEFAKWTDDHVGEGVTYIATQFYFPDDSDIAEVWNKHTPNDIKALVKGVNTIYDPRDDTGGNGDNPASASFQSWSDNPALCLANYLTNDVWGMGIATSKVDWDAVADAADYCDELQSIPGSATQKRFTCNGVLFGTEAHQNNVSKLLSSMNGSLVYTGGKYVINAGQYIAPGVDDILTEDDLNGHVTLTTTTKRADRFNTVTGIFNDPDQLHKQVEFPKVQISSAVTRDNSEVLTKQIQLSMTNNVYMAQRLAYQMIKRSNDQMVLDFPANLKALRVAIGDRVKVTINQFAGSEADPISFVNKVFVCTNFSFTDSNAGGVNLTLVEDTEANYYDTTVTPALIMPVAAYSSVDLSDGSITDGFRGVPAPSSLSAVGVAQGIALTWTNPLDPLEFDNIKIYRVPGTASTFVSGDVDQIYYTKNNFYNIFDIAENTTFTFWIEAIKAGSASSKVGPDSATAGTLTADSIPWTDVTSRNIGVGISGDDITLTGVDTDSSTATGQGIAQSGVNEGITTTSGGITFYEGGSIKSTGKDSESDSTAGFFLGWNASANSGNGSYTFGVGDSSQNMQYADGALSVTGAVNATSGSFTGTVTVTAGSTAPSISDTTLAGKGILLKSDGDMLIGDTAGKYLFFDQSAGEFLVNAQVETANFTLDPSATVTGQIEASSVADGSITVADLSQTVWNEIDSRLSGVVGSTVGDYETAAGNVGSGATNVDLAAFTHASNDITLELNIDDYWSSSNDYSGSALQATLQFQRADDSSFTTNVTDIGSAKTITIYQVDFSYMGGGYVYRILYDATETITGLAAGTYYFRAKFSSAGSAWADDTSVAVNFFANEDGTGATATGGNATTLDSLDSTQFLRSDTDDTFDGDLTVTGTLILQGSIDQYNVTDLNVTDKTITVNSGNTQSLSDGAGLIVDRGTAADASLLWDETNDEFDLSHDLNLNTKEIRAHKLHAGNPNTYFIKAEAAPGDAIAVSGNITATGSLDGTTISASGTTIVDASQNLTNIGTYSGDGRLTITTTDNIPMLLKNTGTGAGNYSEIHISNDADEKLIIGSIGSNYTNANWAGSRYVYSTDGELRIKAATNLRLYSGGHVHTTNLVMTADSSQNATFTGNVTAVDELRTEDKLVLYNDAATKSAFFALATGQNTGYVHLKNSESAPTVLRLMPNGSAQQYAYLELWSDDYDDDTSNFGRTLLYRQTDGVFGIKNSKTGTGTYGNIVIENDAGTIATFKTNRDTAFNGTVSTDVNGVNFQMDGGGSARGLQMQPDSSTTYPVFLKSVNPTSGEASPWIYREHVENWGIFHNNPINTIDITRSASGSYTTIAVDVGGGDNEVVHRFDMADGDVQHHGHMYVYNKADISGAGTGGDPVLDVEASNDTTFVHGMELMAPSLSSGNHLIAVIGRESSSLNSGYIGYKYYGTAGSASNTITFGHWGADDLIEIDGSGNLYVNDAGIYLQNNSSEINFGGAHNSIRIDMTGDNAHTFGTESYHNLYGPPSGGWDSGIIGHKFFSNNGQLIAKFGEGGQSGTRKSFFYDDLEVSGTVKTDGDYVQGHYTGAKKLTGLNAVGTQAKRYHIGRAYYTPRHWSTEAGTLIIRLNQHSYTNTTIEYHISAWYSGGADSPVRLECKNVIGNDSSDVRVVVGSQTDSGYDYAGQNIYYQDIYVEVDFYQQYVAYIVATDGNIQNSNFTSGWGGWTIYDSPTSSNISAFAESHTTVYTPTPHVYKFGLGVTNGGDLGSQLHSNYGPLSRKANLLVSDVASSGANATIAVECENTGEASLYLAENSSSSGYGARLYYEGAGDNFFNISMYDAGASVVNHNAFTIDRYSKVGINDTTPAARLSVYEDASQVTATFTHAGVGSYGPVVVIGAETAAHTLLDTNQRPVLVVDGSYPVLNLNHNLTTNSNHGPTIQFTFDGYTAGGGAGGRQIVIGADGQGQRLDFGFAGGSITTEEDGTAASNSNKNPHNGIAGYQGRTPMRLFPAGLLLGETGGYSSEVSSIQSTLDVRGEKLTVLSDNSNYGQVEIIKPGSAGEVSIGFINGVASSNYGDIGDGGISASYKWAIGVNPYGAGANVFAIGNASAAATVLRLDASGNLNINGGFKSSAADDTPAGTAFANAVKGVGDNYRTMYFDGHGSSVSTWYGVGNNPFAAIDCVDGQMALWANDSAGTWRNIMTLSASGINTNGYAVNGSGHINLTNKSHYFGASTNWDAVGFANQTNVHFQGHNQFWIGAGNGTWFAGSANSQSTLTGASGQASHVHDLLITTMESAASVERGITFAVDSTAAGTSGWRMGKWHSGTSAYTSALIVDGSMHVRGGYQSEPNYPYYANLHNSYYNAGGGTSVTKHGWGGDTGADWNGASITAATALQIQSGNHTHSSGVNSNHDAPQLQFHHYGYGGPAIQYYGPAQTLTIGEINSTTSNRLDWVDIRTHGVGSSRYLRLNYDQIQAIGGALHIQHSTNQNVYMVCSAGGNVGIGADVAAQKLHVHGQIIATSNITAYYSDERLKDQTGEIENAVESLRKIKTLKYKINELAKFYGFEDEDEQIGVTAQSVAEVFPQVVKPAPFDMERADKDDANSPLISKTGKDYKTVQYDRLVPVLIRAIQEQDETIQELLTAVKELKNAIDEK